jgi:hypothetical protein
MPTLMTLLLMAANFAISWFNAKSVGRIWSESKQIGGGARALAVSGYVMAIIGFTMVYSFVLMFLFAAIGPSLLHISTETTAYLLQLVGDLSYILIGLAIIPTGIIIWINSLIAFWKRKTLRGGMIAGWNTFATVSNVVSAARNMPSAFSRVASSLRNQRGNGAVVLLAILIVLMAILGGYFTASAIMKRADRKYDLYAAVRGHRPVYS